MSPGQSTVQKWTGQFSSYEREFSKWEKRVDKILKRYRDDDRPNRIGNAKFNVLWANVQTLIPATYSRTPQADVSRRFRDNDPVGRVASLILERAIDYEIEHYPDFRETMKACVFDRFLGGRGTAWARYEPHILAKKQNLPTDGDQISEDFDEPQEELDYECAPVDYVHWRDFGHTIARTWDEVSGVWRRVYLTKSAFISRFGEELAKKIPFDTRPEDEKKGEMAGDDSQLSRACVYEVWDKETKKALWISKSYPEPLDEKDDPLGLEEFFPCPKPLYATLTNESLIPVPDFSLYQDQARELDTLAERMDGLIQSLQVKGVYDSATPSLSRIFTEGVNGTLIPVDNWAAFAEKNGLKGSMDIVDLKPIYEALQACYKAVQEVLKQIYDLTGLSDIVRGQSNANETATAQQIKGQYASLRLKAMQGEVAYFATQLIRLKAQIICAKFSTEAIAKMAAVDQLSQADQQLLPQAAQLLLGDRFQNPDADPGPNPTRDFRIEVNADSMIQTDEQQEKENRVEFITAQATFMEKALPMAQASPEITPLIASLWKFGVQAFKVGKTLEGEFDQVIDQLRQAASQPKQPKPDPEMERVKADQQAQMARVQADQQTQQARLQFEQQKLQMENMMEINRARMDMQLEQQKNMNDTAFERWKALLEAQTRKEVAEISANATESSSQMSAARNFGPE